MVVANTCAVVYRQMPDAEAAAKRSGVAASVEDAAHLTSSKRYNSVMAQVGAPAVNAIHQEVTSMVSDPLVTSLLDLRMLGYEMLWQPPGQWQERCSDHESMWSSVMA